VARRGENGLGVVPERQRRRLALEVRIHAPEPGPDGVRGLPASKNAEHVVGVPEARLWGGLRWPRAHSPTAFTSLTAGDDGDEALAQGLAELGGELIRGKPGGGWWACRSRTAGSKA